MSRKPTTKQPAAELRCAIYTRKSTEDGLEQEFNSLDAQREAGEAYIKSQASEGWVLVPTAYDDGGYSGGNVERPALQRLLADIEAGKVDAVVVYKVDRLSRSLLDFAKMMEVFDRRHVSFVSVTQQINTGTSMGRLVLNVLLSFAQFEREIISERTRDKIAATKRKGKWCGGRPVLGYDVVDTKLVVNESEAAQVREIFGLYLTHQGMVAVATEINRRGWRTKRHVTKEGKVCEGRPFDKGSLYQLLTNVTYVGQTKYKDELHPGQHQALIDEPTWRKVQSLLQRNGRGNGPARNGTGALLKGLLRCACCDSAMCPSHTTKGNRRYRYYTCLVAQKQGWDACPSKSIPAGAVEQAVVDQIKAIGRDPALVAETVRQAQRLVSDQTTALEREETRLRRELAASHKELQKLAGGDGVATRLADVQDRIAGAERRVGEIEAELERLARGALDESEVAEGLARFDEVWGVLSPREQARVLNLLVERVDFDGRDETISVTFHACGIKGLANRREDAA